MLNRKYLLSIGLFLLITLANNAQTDFYKIFTAAEIQQANTAEKNDSITSVEKEVITISNLFRLYPERIAEKYLQPYYDSAKNEITSYTKSLIKDLKKAKPISALTYSPFYYKAAQQHALSMGKSGKTGHDKMDKRMKGWQKINNIIGENCSYGEETAFGIVMQLMIDEGVSNLGHRKNILNPSFQLVGVSIAPHKKYKTNCVMDFGGNKVGKKKR